MIKVIKRNATPEFPRGGSKKLAPTQTVTAIINSWIGESRQQRLDEDGTSRKTIAGGPADAKIS